MRLVECWDADRRLGYDSLKVFVAFTATGLLATLLVEETNQETLEMNSNEPQEHFISGKVLRDDYCCWFADGTCRCCFVPGQVMTRYGVNLSRQESIA